ncbi:MAG TPA: YdcF family protein [Epsilonproteobacteria bacterium]|nr:YdcF family protein [Campylobacterota bacterium]
MREVKIKFYILLLIAVTSSLLIYNLGRILDRTQEPKVSDIVICLGGGTKERTEKSIHLVAQGYSRSKQLLMVGESWYNHALLDQYASEMDILLEEASINTMEEVRYIKRFMALKGYDSAIIVTDPPHSARVRLLADYLSVTGEGKYSFTLVNSDVPWWDSLAYYKNSFSQNFVESELLAIAHHIVIYGILPYFK